MSDTTIQLSWGDRKNVEELVERFKAGLPNVQGAPTVALAALAQFALAHDLDPWNGEVWLCIKKDETGRIVDTWVQGGIKGRRKLARQQLNKIDPRENYYLSWRRIPPEEYQSYGFKPNVLMAEECILRRSDVTARYISQLDHLAKITGSYEEARRLLGDPPVYVGVGVVYANDRSRMEKHRLVRKRAEDHALSQAFDLPFADRPMTPDVQAVGFGPLLPDEIEGEIVGVDGEGESAGNGQPEPPFEGPYADAPGDGKPAEKPAPVKAGPRSPVALKAWFKAEIESNRRKPDHEQKYGEAGISDTMRKLNKAHIFDNEECRHIFQAEIVGFTSLKDMDRAHGWAYNLWAQNPHARAEADLVIAEIEARTNPAPVIAEAAAK